MTAPPTEDTALTAGAPLRLDDEAPGLAERPPGKRRRRWILLSVAAALLAGFIALVVVSTDDSSGGAYDPRSASPSGTRALAALLRDAGVAVQPGSALGPGRTVVVPFPYSLDSGQLDAVLDSGADVVLIGPPPRTLPDVDGLNDLAVVSRSPSCDLPAARVAGTASLGGRAYGGPPDAITCYDGSLLLVPPTGARGRVVVLGDGRFLTNRRLAQDGNAALAIGLLAEKPQLTWYTARRTTEGTTLTDLLPGRVGWVILQLAVAVALVAAWRARRLGPVVTEPLPVVVRAGETVMGRARLYAAARARGTAAESLRTASRARIATLLHLGPSASAQALVIAVTERVGVDALTVTGMLYGNPPGAAPGSDAALVQLATDLDRLEKEVARQ